MYVKVYDQCEVFHIINFSCLLLWTNTGFIAYMAYTNIYIESYLELHIQFV